ncbi:SET domain-containing protein [Endozoicomonas sp. 4G]|uniref:SET domain-containing protein n=1 Tax=Endozoicomonas sp. 4G TaxID=2872754 RepID=UPI002078A67E|nr:SET domain-containing protein [Endozoicomonas sp. 4G]
MKRPFADVDAAAPPAKKSCLRQVEPTVAEKSLPSSSCNNNCLADFRTAMDLAMLFLEARKIKPVPGQTYLGIVNPLSSFRDEISAQIARLTQNDENPVVNGQAAMYSPESPDSERPVTPLSSSSSNESNARFKTSTKGVVHGTGVIATDSFKKDEVICTYDGPLVYRIPIRNTGKYHVFAMKDAGNNGFNDIKFMDKDSFVVWPGVAITKSGRPAIQIGRDGQSDIRFLNHSKEANVMICYKGKGWINWGDQDSLQLEVMAIKDIKLGEELVFDYDTTKKDSEIDFSKSMVETATEEQKKDIIARINKFNKGLHTEKTRSAKTMNKEIELPDALDNKIADIKQKIDEIRKENVAPATLDQFKAALNVFQKALLKIIYSDKPSTSKDLASHLFPGKNGPEKRAFMEELTTEAIEDLKKFLTRTMFNGSQVWFTDKELKKYLSSLNL